MLFALPAREPPREEDRLCCCCCSSVPLAGAGDVDGDAALEVLARPLLPLRLLATELRPAGTGACATLDDGDEALERCCDDGNGNGDGEVAVVMTSSYNNYIGIANHHKHVSINGRGS